MKNKPKLGFEELDSKIFIKQFTKVRQCCSNMVTELQTHAQHCAQVFDIVLEQKPKKKKKPKKKQA